ncbi:MAG: tyrosine-type recombinase/integrase, partial [Candidatus Kapabacteria bacterium]|nr:tyrosine-type recombinase/integrase [Candidatus Kapabacteria bacterium]
RKAHMRKIGWHTFRHTFASHLAQHGVAIQLIKELLGHSDITTTMRYAHLSPSALREAMNVLEPRSGKAISFGHNLVTIGKLTPFMDQNLTPITLNNSLI